MTDVIDFLEELKELKELYRQNDLREIDFTARIRELEQEVNRFEEEYANE